MWLNGTPPSPLTPVLQLWRLPLPRQRPRPPTTCADGCRAQASVTRTRRRPPNGLRSHHRNQWRRPRKRSTSGNTTPLDLPKTPRRRKSRHDALKQAADEAPNEPYFANLHNQHAETLSITQNTLTSHTDHFKAAYRAPTTSHLQHQISDLDNRIASLTHERNDLYLKLDQTKATLAHLQHEAHRELLSSQLPSHTPDPTLHCLLHRCTSIPDARIQAADGECQTMAHRHR